VSCSIDFVEKFALLKLEDAQQIDAKLNSLANIISFEKVLDRDILEKCQKAGLKIYSFDEVLAAGLDLINAPDAFTPKSPTRDDVFMLSYTSGTTGDPKGVKLTHKMIVMTSAANAIRGNDPSTMLGESDTYISYLPAAHSYE
jgi:long-chain acyl-CoA synthetase